MACEPHDPSLPFLRKTPSFSTESKIVPTMWNELSIFGPASRTKIRTRWPVPTLSGASLYWLATPLNTTKSGAGAPTDAFSRLVMSPCGPRYHSLWTRANSLSTLGRPAFGSTMTMPYIPLAMWCRAGAVPQWYIHTPA